MEAHAQVSPTPLSAGACRTRHSSDHLDGRSAPFPGAAPRVRWRRSRHFEVEAAASVEEGLSSLQQTGPPAFAVVNMRLEDHNAIDRHRRPAEGQIVPNSREPGGADRLWQYRHCRHRREALAGAVDYFGQDPQTPTIMSITRSLLHPTAKAPPPRPDVGSPPGARARGLRALQRLGDGAAAQHASPHPAARASPSARRSNFSFSVISAKDGLTRFVFELN